MNESRSDLLLIERYFDGIASKQDIREIETRLVEEEKFSDSFARAGILHRQISELITENRLHKLLDEAASHSPAISVLSQNRKVISTKHSLDQSNKTKKRTDFLKLVSLSLAASLAIGFFYWTSYPLDENTIEAAKANQFENLNGIAATVTHTKNCEWSEEFKPLSVGDQVAEGQKILLNQGLLKLIFESGAEVTLQGPCEIDVVNSMLGYLRSGNATASVPPRAFSFAIRAPGLDIIDLGTDFGVSVGDDGNSELHVFEGEVIYRQDNSTRKSSEVFHVAEDNAVRFTSPTVLPTDIALNSKLFKNHFGLRQDYQDRVELPVTDKLALWLAANHEVNIDEYANLLAWHDSLIGDNKSSEDAFPESSDASPMFIPNAINGLPVIRFDGDNDYLLTTPLMTTDNQTVFLVCQFTEASFSADRKYGGQIINYDGPPTRELTNTLAPGVLQIGEPLLQEEFYPSSVTAQVFAGFIGMTTVEAARIDAAPVGPNHPLIVVYKYDFENRSATLEINGKIIGASNAFAPAALTSRKVIGRHSWMDLFFNGDLAEVLIYNDALSTDDVDQVVKSLSKKYSISLTN